MADSDLLLRIVRRLLMNNHDLTVYCNIQFVNPLSQHSVFEHGDWMKIHEKEPSKSLRFMSLFSNTEKGLP
jgi:hypothetical protein